MISTCAFGFRAHTLTHPDSDFRIMTKKIVEPHFNFKLRSLMLAISPKLCKIFKVRMFDPEAVDYFINLVDETIKYREKYHVVRNDFIDLLIAVKREEEAANEKDKNRPRKIGEFKIIFVQTLPKNNSTPYNTFKKLGRAYDKSVVHTFQLTYKPFKHFFSTRCLRTEPSSSMLRLLFCWLCYTEFNLGGNSARISP